MPYIRKLILALAVLLSSVAVFAGPAHATHEIQCRASVQFYYGNTYMAGNGGASGFASSSSASSLRKLAVRNAGNNAWALAGANPFNTTIKAFQVTYGSLPSPGTTAWIYSEGTFAHTLNGGSTWFYGNWQANCRYA